MPLIICSDCKKEISDAAASCPHCGRPTKEALFSSTSANSGSAVAAATSKSVSLSLGIGILLLPYIFSWFTLRNGYSTKVRAVSFLWLAVALALQISNIRSSGQTANSIAAPSTVRTAATVNSYTLAQAYESNEAAADAKYKGELLLVSGTLNSIQKDFSDDTFITLEAGNFLEVHASLKESEISKAINLRKGQTVGVLCIGGGEVLGTPMLRDCEIKMH